MDDAAPDTKFIANRVEDYMATELGEVKEGVGVFLNSQQFYQCSILGKERPVFDHMQQCVDGQVRCRRSMCDLSLIHS